MKSNHQKLLLLWLGTFFFIWGLPACVLTSFQAPQYTFYNPSDVDLTGRVRHITASHTFVRFQYMSSVDTALFDPASGMFIPTSLGCNCSEGGGGGFSLPSFGGGSSPPTSSYRGNTGGNKTGTPPDVTDQSPAAQQEADLLRMNGSTLYWLSESQGLRIFSLKKPEQPKVLGKLAIKGRPVEMFVEKNRAVIFVTRVVEWKKGFSSYTPTRVQTSRVLFVDVSVSGKPKVIQSLPIRGLMKAGLVRRIGDVLYIATYSPKSNFPGVRRPQDEVEPSILLTSVEWKNDRLEKRQDYEFLTSDRWKVWDGLNWGLYFRSLVMTVRDNVLMLAEQWLVQRSDVWEQCSPRVSWPVTTRDTVLHLVDLKQNEGRFHVFLKNHRFRGHLNDQFNQSFVRNNESGVYYGITTTRVYEDCQSILKNAVFSLKISLQGGEPQELDRIHVGKPNEDTRASLFDHKRQVLYVITATGDFPRDWKPQSKSGRSIRRFVPRSNPFWTDPLYAISLKKPDGLKVLSEIDHLNGDMTLFRTIQNGQFLLAVGRDQSEHCTGFEVSKVYKDGARTKVAVSIVDVRDLKKISLVQRRCIEVSGLSSSMLSGINEDLGQSHKVSNLVQENGLRLVLNPVMFKAVEPSTKQIKTHVAVGVMSWDLSKFDPYLSHKKQTVLQPRGTLQHVDGEVKRVFYLSRFLMLTKRHLFVSLSDSALTVSELDSSGKTQKIGSLVFGNRTHNLYNIGDFRVEQKVPSHDPNSGMRLVVRKKQGGTIVKEFAFGEWQQIARWNDWLVIATPAIEKDGKPSSRKTTFSILYFGNKNKPNLQDTSTHEIVLAKRAIVPGKGVSLLEKSDPQPSWWKLKTLLHFVGAGDSKSQVNLVFQLTPTKLRKRNYAKQHSINSASHRQEVHRWASSDLNTLYTTTRETTNDGQEAFDYQELHFTNKSLSAFHRWEFAPGRLLDIASLRTSTAGAVSFFRQGNLMR
jgi:hypothetical protein